MQYISIISDVLHYQIKCWPTQHNLTCSLLLLEDILLLMINTRQNNNDFFSEYVNADAKFLETKMKVKV